MARNGWIMLDKILIDHLDKMDNVSDDIEILLDKVFKSLDIDEIIENPQEAMLESATLLSELIINNILKDSVKNGRDLADKIEALKRGDKIDLPSGKDPKVNEGLANDKSRD
jgi:hypothetical protein